jgi:Family of unknown function (DUF6011)
MCKENDIFAGLESVDVYAESAAADTAAPAESRDMSGRLTTAGDATRYMLAGAATITLRSEKTGNRFTFKVSAPKDKDTGKADLNSDFRFVSVLVGPDNWSNYKYFGYIRRGVFFHGGAKAKVSAAAPSAKAFYWAWRQLSRGALPESLAIFHAGICGRCGRKLTVPESIVSGFGPECQDKIGL